MSKPFGGEELKIAADVIRGLNDKEIIDIFNDAVQFRRNRLEYLLHISEEVKKVLSVT